MNIYALAEACAAVVLGVDGNADDSIGFALFAGEPWEAMESAVSIAMTDEVLLARLPLDELIEYVREDGSYLASYIPQMEDARSRRQSVSAQADHVIVPALTVHELIGWYGRALEEVKAHDWIRYAHRCELEGRAVFGLASLVAYAWHQDVDVPRDVQEASLYYLSTVQPVNNDDADSLAIARTLGRMLNSGHPSWSIPIGKVEVK